MAPWAAIASSRAAPPTSKASVTSPSSPRPSTVAARLPRRQTLLVGAELDAVPRLEPLGRTRQSLPAMIVEPLDQGDGDLRRGCRRARVTP